MLGYTIQLVARAYKMDLAVPTYQGEVLFRVHQLAARAHRRDLASLQDTTSSCHRSLLVLVCREGWLRGVTTTGWSRLRRRGLSDYLLWRRLSTTRKQWLGRSRASSPENTRIQLKEVQVF